MGLHHIFFRDQLPKDVSVSLVSWENPAVQVTNSDLEMSYSVIHHNCMSDFNEVWERTTLSRTDNTAGLWWQRKGYATFTPPRTTYSYCSPCTRSSATTLPATTL